MTFTKEQMEILKQYEDSFRTAVNADWARNPGRFALQTIHGIYTGATGDKRRFDDNCQHCIVSLLRDCGRLYYNDKVEMEKAKEVKAEDIPVKKVRAKVKTKK